MAEVATRVEGEVVVVEALQWHQDLTVLAADSTTGEEARPAEEVVEEAATVGLTAATVKIPTMNPQHRTLMVNGEVLKTPTIAVRTVDLRTVDMGTKTTRTMHHTTTVMIRTSVVMKVRCRLTNLY